MRIQLATLAIVGLMISNSAMAVGDPAQGEIKAASCAACHGVGGESMVPTFPKLAGQGEAYLMKQLTDYASGDRSDQIMSATAATLSEQDKADLAAYYAKQTRKANDKDATDFAEGEMLYRAGNKATGVPACMACHGPNGAGVPAAAWPALAGQNEAYTVQTMTDFASGARQNDANEMMRDIAAKMTEAEIKAVSAYIQHALH